MATREILHMVEIGTHASFEDAELFEIVHRNWPDLIAGSRAQNVTSADNLTAEARGRLRKAGLTMMTVTGDGSVYMPHGMGQMTSGVNSTVVIRADHMAARARAFQEWCEDNLERITDEAAKVGVFLAGPDIVLELVEVGTIVVVRDAEGRIWLSLHQMGEVRLSNRLITS